MPLYSKYEHYDRRLLPCHQCGVKPVLEMWSSGGFKCAVRCDNPDRPDSCTNAFFYSMSRNTDETIRRWNEYQQMTDAERQEADSHRREHWESLA